MLFQNNQMCFNEPNYVTVHSVMNIMTTNAARMHKKCHNNVYKLVLYGSCWKTTITSSQW